MALRLLTVWVLGFVVQSALAQPRMGFGQAVTAAPPQQRAVINQAAGLRGPHTRINVPIYNSQRLSFPNRPINGIRMVIDNGWVRTNGYVPVRVEIQSDKPNGFARTRKIRLGLAFQSVDGLAATMSYRDVELPQGASVVNTSVRVFQRAEWANVIVDVREGSEKLEDVSGSYSLATVGYMWRETQDAILLIDSNAPAWADRNNVINSRANNTTLPDLRPLAQVSWNGVRNFDTTGNGLTGLIFQRNSKYTDAEVLQAIRDHRFVGLSNIDEMSDNWIDWTCYQAIVMKWDEFENIRKNHESKFAALKKRLAMGGVLMIYDMGDEFGRLSKLESALGIPAMPEETSQYSNWNYPTLPKVNDPTAVMLFPGQSKESMQFLQTLQQEAMSGKQDKSKVPKFMWRPMGLGYIVGARSASPFKDKIQVWPWMHETLPDMHATWRFREGISMRVRNEEFFNFLIPGVGLPPVNSFLILITLFVIVIGPVNYLLLKKMGRLYLLMVTVPLGAFVVTLLLFTYALLGDGFGVRLRARSFSFIDQKSGTANSVSRQSYYAAFSPSRGLTFPDDSFVIPIDSFQQSASQSEDADNQIRWEDGQQRLLGGFIRARRAAQFMVYYPTTTEAKLGIGPNVEENGSLKVRNVLGTRIKSLVVRFDDGNFYFGENIGVDELVELKPEQLQRLVFKFGRIHTDNLPGFPPFFRVPPSARRRNNRSVRVVPFRRGRQQREQAPKTTTSMLEEKLKEMILDRKGGLPKRSYIAVVEESPIVPYGIENAKQDGSFHVVRGQW